MGLKKSSFPLQLSTAPRRKSSEQRGYMSLSRIQADNFVGDVLREPIQQLIKQCTPKIQYSEKYYDDVHEYRHVIVPKELSKVLPKGYLMSEKEWRMIGVQQSIGWEHYMWHRPEPHVLLFKRAKNFQQMAQHTVTRL